ncbi:MAG: (2Fe-2S) ferredoxin domain-containing protein [Synechococcales bacterium]|nr:(2Fe-2S) ferredoxin domain-containing protein [Synechococcales bacterium]
MTFAFSSNHPMNVAGRAEPREPIAFPSGPLSLGRFSLVGQFLGFEGDREEGLKYLRLQTDGGELTIKLAKLLRHYAHAQMDRLVHPLSPGTWIQVSGEQKPRKGDRAPKLKATRIEVVESEVSHRLSQAPRLTVALVPTVHPPTAAVSSPQPGTPSSHAANKTQKVLICQKSKCWNRGGKEVCQSLQRLLAERDLTDQVQIKLTGCMDQCGRGPNLVVMPTKARYTKVRSQDIEQVVNDNFCP